MCATALNRSLRDEVTRCPRHMQLTVCRAQIHEVELTADRPPRRQPQTALVESERSQPSNRFDHDSLTARLAKHLGNAIAVSHKRSAGWSTANAGSGAFHRHRTRRVF